MRNNVMRRAGTIVVSVLMFTLVLGVVPAFAAANATAEVSVHNVLANTPQKTFKITVKNTEAAGTLNQVGRGLSIGQVRILPPAELIDAILTGSSGPAGFTDIRILGTPPAEIIFKGGTIAPQATAEFFVNAIVTGNHAVEGGGTPEKWPIRQDAGSNWLVRVNGIDQTTTPPTLIQNSRTAGSQGEGLLTTVRVLQVTSTTIVAPAGAADHRINDTLQEVTGSQGQRAGSADDVCVRSTVRNAADIALNVKPQIALSSGVGDMSINAVSLASTPPCSGAPLTGGTASIPSDSTQGFDFAVQFADNTGSSDKNVNIVGTAEVPGLTGPESQTPNTTDADDDTFRATQAIAIEPKAALTYVSSPQSLQPLAVVPSKPGAPNSESFSLLYNKGNGASPSLDFLNSTFTGGTGENVFCNASFSTGSVGAGAVNNQLMQFSECPIADRPDNRYDVFVNYAYTDANGLFIDPTAMNGLPKVRLDSLLPDVDVTIHPPTSQVMGADPAVTNGTAFTASGDMTDAAPGTGNRVPCGTGDNPLTDTSLPCTLDTANLLLYNAAGSQIGSIDVKSNCTLNTNDTTTGDNLNCNINTTGFVPNTVETALQVTVKDEALSTSPPGISLRVDVDLVAPFIESAETARGGNVHVPPGCTQGEPGCQVVAGARRTIVVTFNEMVQIGTGAGQPANPRDWTVQDGSTKTVCSAENGSDKRTVILTTCEEISADVIGGSIVYDVVPVVSAPYHDRVGKNVTDPTQKTLTDGIAPLAPTVDKVHDLDEQPDGATSKFFFNTESPEFILISETPEDDPAIADGYTVEVFKETDEIDGLSPAGDTKLECDNEVASSATLTTVCDFLPEDDRQDDHEAIVYVRSIDMNNNEGTEIQTTLVLDRVLPTLLSSSAPNSGQVTVTFSEPIPRGDEFTDNWLYFGRFKAGQQQLVGLGVDSVTAVSGNPNQRALTVNGFDSGTMNPAFARYRFSTTARYQDRATNPLNDGSAVFAA